MRTDQSVIGTPRQGAGSQQQTYRSKVGHGAAGGSRTAGYPARGGCCQCGEVRARIGRPREAAEAAGIDALAAQPEESQGLVQPTGSFWRQDLRRWAGAAGQAEAVLTPAGVGRRRRLLMRNPSPLRARLGFSRTERPPRRPGTRGDVGDGKKGSPEGGGEGGRRRATAAVARSSSAATRAQLGRGSQRRRPGRAAATAAIQAGRGGASGQEGGCRCGPWWR
ncbi:spidroin-1-like [Ananas comosus]|uniref:Spidroin-1-like n=1 Tax=Ananas comosus TaxID=4615 RepID=A0A6P5FNP0_ANACO|nr:spidroin-1-like [Ananas comosus]